MDNSPLYEDREDSGGHGSNRRTCRCGDGAPIWTAWTYHNPGRRFTGCPNYKDQRKKCNYFAWIDPELPESSKRIILAKYLRSKIEVSDGKLKKLGAEMEQSKLEYFELVEKLGNLKQNCAKMKDQNQCLKIDITKRKEREKWYIVIICVLSVIIAVFLGLSNQVKNNGNYRFLP